MLVWKHKLNIYNIFFEAWFSWVCFAEASNTGQKLMTNFSPKEMHVKMLKHGQFLLKAFPIWSSGAGKVQATENVQKFALKTFQEGVES